MILLSDYRTQILLNQSTNHAINWNDSDDSSKPTNQSHQPIYQSNKQSAFTNHSVQ